MTVYKSRLVIYIKITVIPRGTTVSKKHGNNLFDMQWTFYFTVMVLFCVKGIAAVSPKTISKLCAEERHIPANGSFVITFTNGLLDTTNKILLNEFTSSCTLFVTNPELRLYVNLCYHPSKHDCYHGYISVGNDRFRPDVSTMTSYQFCEPVDDVEIVSRSNILWIMNKRQFGHKINGEITIESRSPVNCNTSWYECSPLQCIPPTQLCNGVKDCENGRDEYCKTNISKECFLCDDGTCISPTLPRYHYNWGKSYWYICDGFKHCKDGSDEKADECKSWSVSSNLHFCTHQRSGQPIATWHIDHCITKDGCLQGYECGKDADISDIRGSAIAITACALFIVLSCCAFIIIKSGKRRRKRRGPPERMTSRCQLYRDGSTSRVATSVHSQDSGQQT